MHNAGTGISAYLATHHIIKVDNNITACIAYLLTCYNELRENAIRWHQRVAVTSKLDLLLPLVLIAQYALQVHANRGSQARNKRR